MKKVIERYADVLNQVFASYSLSPESLGVYRILFALHALLFGSIPSVAYLSAFPDSFFTPPLGIAQAFTGLPSLWICWLLHTATVFAGLCMLLGYRTRTASLAYSLLCMTAYSLAFSLGKINHNTGYFFLPLTFAFSDWGEQYSVDAMRHSRRGVTGTNPTRSAAAVFCYAFALGWMFFTAGIQKLIGGWLSLNTQATFGWFVNYYYAEHTREFLAPYFIHIRIPAFWESADWFTVFFECFFLIAAFRRSRMMLACSFAVIFHFFVLNTLNINSSGFMICYLAFVDWSETPLQRWIARWTSWLKNSTLVGAVMVCCTAALALLGMTHGSAVDTLFILFSHHNSQMPIALIIESVGLFVALRYVFWIRFRQHIKNFLSP